MEGGDQNQTETHLSSERVLEADPNSIIVVTRDSVKIKLDKRIGQMSEIIQNAIGDFDGLEETTEEIPLYMVDSKEMILIRDYCEHFNFNKPNFDSCIPITVPEGKRDQWITDPWELNFIESLSLDELMQLLKAANYLNVPALLELCCASVASIFKGADFEKQKKERDIFNCPVQTQTPPLMEVNQEYTASGPNIKYNEQQDRQLMIMYPWILQDFSDTLSENNK
uniref:Uncharacterized protein n=1 Tax=Strombidium rassoulzadegani TaxID=1082188 RepID=A0A7S3CRP8_9SPIT|mmetsp:Transcript_2501/g.4203  ORF Transcript_2501/g.4203 Transcript_2501/m.4203 type:complete len:225 (+) Transcript_2501:31-705(+)